MVMAIGTLGGSLTAELNRLANGGTYPIPTAFKGDNAAAAQWAGVSDLELIGSLNRKQGITNPSLYMGINAVCNALAGTTGLEAPEALRLISV
jgi:hypothetical protein